MFQKGYNVHDFILILTNIWMNAFPTLLQCEARLHFLVRVVHCLPKQGFKDDDLISVLLRRTRSRPSFTTLSLSYRSSKESRCAIGNRLPEKLRLTTRLPFSKPWMRTSVAVPCVPRYSTVPSGHHCGVRPRISVEVWIFGRPDPKTRLK